MKRRTASQYVEKPNALLEVQMALIKEINCSKKENSQPQHEKELVRVNRVH
jgi:hypothetical protein